MSVLHSYVSTAKDYKALGQPRESEERLRGEELYLLQTRNIRNQRPRTGGDEYPVGFQAAIVDPNLSVLGETTLAFIQIHALQLHQRIAKLAFCLLHTPTHPVHNQTEIDVSDGRIDTKLGGVSDLNDAVSREHEHLGWNASEIRTCAPQRSFVYQRDAQSAKYALIDDKHTRARTDNYCVILGIHNGQSASSGLQSGKHSVYPATQISGRNRSDAHISDTAVLEQ